MPNPTTSALAVTVPNLPAPGSTITASQAAKIAQDVARAALRAAKDENKKRARTLAAELGGQLERLDDDVVEQGRKWAARIAAISAKKKVGRTGGYYGSAPPSDPLDKIVTKITAVLGELEELRLTDRALGLFETLNEHEYVGSDYVMSDGGLLAEDWRQQIGEKGEEAAEEVLAQYTIVDDEPDDEQAQPKPVRRGRGKETPASDEADGE